MYKRQVINGFDFIAVTTTGGCHFDDKKRGFVSAELEKAAERDSKKNSTKAIAPNKAYLWSRSKC